LLELFQNVIGVRFFFETQCTRVNVTVKFALGRACSFWTACFVVVTAAAVVAA